MGTMSPHRRRTTGLVRPDRTLGHRSGPDEHPLKAVALGLLALLFRGRGPVDPHVEASRLVRSDRAERPRGFVVAHQQLVVRDFFAGRAVDLLVLHLDEGAELADAIVATAEVVEA